MPKNTNGGNKHKRQKNSNTIAKRSETPLPSDTENTSLAKITGICGDCRFRAVLIKKDGVLEKPYILHLPGSMKRRGRITMDAIVLISLRGFEEKGDILYLYDAEDIETLKNKGFPIEQAFSRDKTGDDANFEMVPELQCDENYELDLSEI